MPFKDENFTEWRIFKVHKKHHLHRRLLFQRPSQSKGAQAQSLARSYRWILNLIGCHSIELECINYLSFTKSILQKILHHLINQPCYRLRTVCKRYQCHGGECIFMITKQSLLILDQWLPFFFLRLGFYSIIHPSIVASTTIAYSYPLLQCKLHTSIC